MLDKVRYMYILIVQSCKCSSTQHIQVYSAVFKTFYEHYECHLKRQPGFFVYAYKVFNISNRFNTSEVAQ